MSAGVERKGMNEEGKRELATFLNDALYFVCRAELKTKKMTLAGFLKNFDTQDIVCNNFIRFGEVCVRIINRFPRFAEENSDIPWYGVRGIRNALAHLYDKIDYVEVWKGVQRLPDLRKRFVDIMAENDIPVNTKRSTGQEPPF